MFRRLLIPSVVVACMVALTIACFGRAIFQGEQFAYRDSAHYYYPLHQRVQAEWHAGRWPLWEPEENAGMPLMGNPTAAVLYPGKVVFALFPYPVAARVYIIAHTLLAAGAMLALLRNWRTSGTGSALGALAYAFGGPILFQYCNVIYLVGAAWLPLGFLAVDRWLRLGRRGALAGLAVVLAMETLGGDPESAYLTGLCAAGYAVSLARDRKRSGRIGTDQGPPRPRPWRFVFWVVAFLLIVAAWFAVTVAAARWLPSLRPVPPLKKPQPPLPGMAWVGPAVAAAWGLLAFALLSHWRRVRRTGARSVLVPMLAGLAASAVLAAAVSSAQLLPVLEFTGQSGRAAGDGPHDIYPFSLHPLRVVEFLVPNVFGTPYHGNRFWLGALPPGDANPKVWIPTLYLGGLTLVFALASLTLRSRGASPWRAWMTLIAAVSLLGSFGEYGSPLWLARNHPAGARALGPHDEVDVSTIRKDRQLRDGDGGPYWLLATALPGFRQFRFPSKLLTFTVLALAALAGQGWDALEAGDPRVRRRMALGSALLLLVSLAALGLTNVRRPELIAWLTSRRLDSGFGPFDAPGAFAELQRGLRSSVLTLNIAALLSLRAYFGGFPRWLAATLALTVTTVDLAAANARFITTTPQSLFDSTPEVVSLIRQAEKEQPGPGPYRVHRVPLWNPYAWGVTPSPDRVRDFVVWERATAQPKYGITEGVEYTMTLGVAELYDYEWFFGGFYRPASAAAARFLGVPPGENLVVFPRRGFDVWGSRYFILPYYPRWEDEHRGIASFLDRTERIYPAPDAFRGGDGEGKARELSWAKDHDYQIRRNLDAFPRAWVVHEARSVPPIRGLTRADRALPMEEFLFSDDLFWSNPDRTSYDPRRYVWVDESDRPSLAPFLPGDYSNDRETVRVVRHDPDRVELDATLERPGVVVLADVYYPGWTLTVDGVPSRLYRANRLMRGAAVPSGRHTLVYTFRPLSFRVGLVVSMLGLAGLLGFAAWSLFSPVSKGLRPDG